MTNISISALEFNALLKAQKALPLPESSNPENRPLAAALPSSVRAIRKPVKIEYIVKDLPLY